MKTLIKKLIPKSLLNTMLPIYHYLLAFFGAVFYGFPSKRINIVFVTGTKGKSSTSEIVNRILEEAGYRTALVSTIRFKVGDNSQKNLLKMTTPGRFFLNRILHDAINAKCDWVIIEMSSEAARQYRHKFISANALIFTNITPEHIERHGGFENYLSAKLSIARSVAKSKKRPRTIVSNIDDDYGVRFLSYPVENKIPYSLNEVTPYTATDSYISFTLDETKIQSSLIGEFNIMNSVAASRFAQSIGIDTETIKKALSTMNDIPGRAEHINLGQPFDVIVDYAHTNESLIALYKTFKDKKTVCVLGSAGGGRDTWKRPLMGKTADTYCNTVILTDEDPYNEDPSKIIDDMIVDMKRKPTIIMDRREAIAYALKTARESNADAVLITGKGTDPFIMRANGTQERWSDKEVTEEELNNMLQ